jgi:hypothetical protein
MFAVMTSVIPSANKNNIPFKMILNVSLIYMEKRSVDKTEP